MSTLGFSMNVRRAEPADCATLSAIVYAAKAHWGYRPSDLESWKEQLSVTEASVREHPTHLVEVSGHVVAFYQLASSEGAWELQHFWVHPSFMGRGIGRRLFAHALENAAKCGATFFTVDADPNAEGFYLACGAVRTGAIAAPIEGERGRVRPQLRVGVSAT